MSDYILEVEHLKQYFPIRTGILKTTPLKAVDDVTFKVGHGETLGLVGESGCGKTTVGRSIMRLYEPTGGSVKFDGVEITDKNITQLRRKMQMVFQDPYSSLDPRMTVEDIIGEPLDVHHLYSNRKERREKILHLMDLVGLNAEARYPVRPRIFRRPAAAHRYIAPARSRWTRTSSSATKPVSALDVSIQAQVIKLFEDLQKKTGVPICSSPTTFWSSTTSPSESASCILATLCGDGNADELMGPSDFTHTRSRCCLAVPIPDPGYGEEKKHRIVLEGDVPSPLKNAQRLSRFRTRLPLREGKMRSGVVRPDRTGRRTTRAACWNK